MKWITWKVVAATVLLVAMNAPTTGAQHGGFVFLGEVAGSFVAVLVLKAMYVAVKKSGTRFRRRVSSAD